MAPPARYWGSDMFKTKPNGLTDAQVFEFRATGLSPDFCSGAQVLVVDRADGLAEFALARRAFRMVNTYRASSLEVICEKDSDSRVLARLDCSGQSNLELVRLLNQTGFRGVLLFAGPVTSRTQTLMRLLNELAIDFSVEHRCFEALDDALPMTFNAA